MICTFLLVEAQANFQEKEIGLMYGLRADTFSAFPNRRSGVESPASDSSEPDLSSSKFHFLERGTKERLAAHLEKEECFKDVLVDSDHDTDEYQEYQRNYIVEALEKDAYYIGFLAARARCSTRGEWLHVMAVLVVLWASILCQVGMTLFMRFDGITWRQLANQTVVEDISMPLVLQRYEELHVNSLLLVMGMWVFFLQFVVEENQVSIFLRALNSSDDGCFDTVTFLKLAKRTVSPLMLVAGMHILIMSKSNTEVLLNCTALSFVVGLDDIAISAVCPKLTSAMLKFHFRFKKRLNIDRMDESPIFSYSGVAKILAVMFSACLWCVLATQRLNVYNISIVF